MLHVLGLHKCVVLSPERSLSVSLCQSFFSHRLGGELYLDFCLRTVGIRMLGG